MVDSGFEILNGALSVYLLDRLNNVLQDEVPAHGRAGARHLMKNAAIAAIARDDELVNIARRWLGRTAVPYRATLFEKSGAKNWLVAWHQDTALPLTSRNELTEWGPWSPKEGVIYAGAPGWALANVVALRLHLDPCKADNGPLRVIPGSHAAGVLPHAEILCLAREQASVDCIVGRGGVMTMRPLLVHASSRVTGSGPRRVLHIEYSPSLDVAPGIHLALA